MVAVEVVGYTYIINQPEGVNVACERKEPREMPRFCPKQLEGWKCHQLRWGRL